MEFNVSVVIPVYNAEPFLDKAVRSVLQCPEVKQVVLAEDGSKDRSLEIAQSLATEFDEVEVHQHPDKQNHGAGATRNLALKHCDQNFIAFLDADDFYLSERFEVTKNVFIENTDADGVYEAIGTHFYSEEAKKKYTKNELTTINHKVPPEKFFDEFLLGGGFASLDGITVKRSFMDSLGPFDPNLRQSQDTDMVMRMAWKGRMYPGSLNKPVTIRGVHDDNRIHNREAAFKYAGMLASKWLGLMSSNQGFSKEVTHKIFYRAITNHKVELHNGQRLHNGFKNRLFALSLLFKYPSILFKLNFKDLLSGFKSGFR